MSAGRGRAKGWNAFRVFIDDEGGYTSLAVMLAVTLAVVLCLSAIQATWVGSTASTTQHVADASALAAQNVVAKYLTIAKVLDALILSLSLTGAFLLIIATVVSCIPYVQVFGEPLFEAGRKVLSARNDLSGKALQALNSMQDALPLLMQVNAQAVARENSAHIHGASYSVVALPFPLKGEPLVSTTVEVDTDALEEANAKAREQAKEAERYEEEMSHSLDKAFRADCVDDPMCMRQRAATLAGMDGASNPTFTSPEHWNFSVPLERARSYYRLRFLQEQAAGLDPEPVEAARDFARREFYAIAIEKLVDGYANSTGDLGKGLNIPVLPRNTDDMRGEAIYTEVRFPVSSDGVLHYSTSCPGYGGGGGLGSLAQQEAGTFGICARCEFSIKTLGDAPAASTNINNGFEHYYRIVALAAQDYREASEKEQDCLGEARSFASSVRSILGDLLKEITGDRIEAHPPGETGCVVLAVDVSAVDSPFALGPRATVPPRVAMSGAALVEYPEDEGATVLTNAFGSITGKAHSSGGASVLAQPMLSFWGNLLNAYGDGATGVKDALGTLLNAIPGFSSSSSSGWGSEFASDLLDETGLAPADTNIVRPCLVNTARVFASDEEGIGAHLASAQQSYLAAPGEGAGSGIDEVVSMVEGLARQMERLGAEKLESEFSFGSISLFGPISIPVTVTLPPAVVETGTSLLSDARTRLIQAVQGALSSTQGGYRQWR